MNRPHGNSCFCITCATIFAEGKNDPVLQRPKKSPEETQEAAGEGQAQDDSSRTLIPGPLRVKWIEDILRDNLARQEELEKQGKRFTPLTDFMGGTATLHPHTNCPRCSEEKKPPEAGDPELQALISCMRTSAQETLVSLHRKGWKIVQA